MSITRDRLIDLRNLMVNFPKNATLDMNKWTPQDSKCGTACCAAGNAIIYLKSWSDHLEFQGHNINFNSNGTDFIGDCSYLSTISVLLKFLPMIDEFSLRTIFIHPSTTEEVAKAIDGVLEYYK